MDRVRFITHQSKRILLVPEEVMERLTQVQHIVTTQPRNSVLTFSDLTCAEFGRAAITRMKEVAVFDRPYGKRAALVGAHSLPKVFYEALKAFSQREFHRFETREEAMDWLVKRRDHNYPSPSLLRSDMRALS
jgi:hypothetical protein